MFALCPVSFPPNMSQHTAAFSFSPEFFLFLISLLNFFLFHIFLSLLFLDFTLLVTSTTLLSLSLSLSLSLLSLSLTFLSCVVEVEPYVGTPRRRALYFCPCCAPEGNVNPVMFAASQLCYHNNMASGITLTIHWTCGVLLLPFNYKVYSSPCPCVSRLSGFPPADCVSASDVQTQICSSSRAGRCFSGLLPVFDSISKIMHLL